MVKIDGINRRIVKAILKTYPESRDRFEVLMIIFIKQYLGGDINRLTGWSIRALSREMQYVQNTLGKYKPTEPVRKKRRSMQQAFREKYSV